jgi:hypothetical protein
MPFIWYDGHAATCPARMERTAKVDRKLFFERWDELLADGLKGSSDT